MDEIKEVVTAIRSLEKELDIKTINNDLFPKYTVQVVDLPIDEESLKKSLKNIKITFDEIRYFLANTKNKRFSNPVFVWTLLDEVQLLDKHSKFNYNFIKKSSNASDNKIALKYHQVLIISCRSFLKFIDKTIVKNNFSDIIKPELKEPIPPSAQWNSNQTEFMELVKSLIENGNVKGKQKDIITSFSHFFNITINNPDKLLTDIKKRNTESETLFLDKLKSSLLCFINREKTR